MYKISLATQSLWDRSLLDAAETAARIGYDGIEIVCHDPFLTLPDLWALRASAPRRIRELGLAVASLTVITDFTNPKTVSCNAGFLSGIVDLAESYGTDLVKMSPGPPVSSKASSEEWLRAVKRIADCAEHAQSRGVSLAIETHLGQLSDTEESTFRLVQEIGRPNVGVVLDWCNVLVTGGDPLNAVRLLAPHLRLIHAKDCRRTPQTPRWVRIGRGELNYPALMAALRETRYRGMISVEALLSDTRYDFDGGSTDPEETVSADLAALRGFTAAQAT